MLRLGKSLCLAFAAVAVLIPAHALSAQTTAAQPAAVGGQTPSATTQQSVPATAQPAKTRAHRKKQKAAAVAEVPQTPTPPPTLEQSPPTAPNITYRNGELTIDAHNSTLSQVLRSVQTQTGASVEFPANAANERVVTQLGPGQPRDVLNTLLNGSKFDYVILGVTGDPGAVQRVILTPRQTAPSGTVNAAQNTAPQAFQNQAQIPEEEPQPEDSYQPSEGEAENQNQDQPPGRLPPGGFRRPMPGQMPSQMVDQSQYGNPEQQNGVKTPEQLMQELQQMQQQQQNYQQQLNPANQNPQQYPQQQ